MVWLCTEHQKQDGITVLSDEVADVNAISLDAGADMSSAFQNLTSNTESDAAARPMTAGRKPADTRASKASAKIATSGGGASKPTSS